MIELTKKQLNNWAAHQRIKYNKGLLTTEQIEKLEAVPGWKWIVAIDYEQQSNEMCHKVCMFMKENGRNPSKKSKNKNEKDLAGWLDRKKTSSQGKYGRHF